MKPRYRLACGGIYRIIDTGMVILESALKDLESSVIPGEAFFSYMIPMVSL